MDQLVGNSANVAEKGNKPIEKENKMEEKGHILRKSGKNSEKVAKTIEKENKTMEKTPKVDENVIDMTVTEGVIKAREELKKKNAVSKPKAKVVQKVKTSNKGGDIMVDKFVDHRVIAEKALIKVCKELKMNAPERIAAKRTSTSGLSTFRSKDVNGEVKVAIRATDICIYSPPKVVKFGSPYPSYPQITIMSWGDANLEKAFTNAMKDKKSSSQWATELGWVNPRTKKAVKTITDVSKKMAGLEVELKKLKALKAEMAKTKTKKRTKRSKVIQAVAPVTV